MTKIQWKPGTMIYPVPAVMVSCGNSPENYNIITIAWTGTISTNPPMCYISVQPKRYSYNLIKETGEFVINLTTKKLARATDWCGVKSGKDVDKFKEMNLTPVKGHKVNAPIIDESPLCIECKVLEIKELGSHHMFIAEVVNVQADDNFLNNETGAFSLESSEPIAYSHGHYYELGNLIGRFGYSVRKRKKNKKSTKKK